jgi:NADH:ubiquinone oxidoreductase subunit 5 (subunit L)/multisubunit Na+/H+ antiporter MnhA subunit
MSDFHGPITHATIASGLWALPLAPLLAAAWCLYAQVAPALRKAPRGKAKSPDGLALANAAALAAAVALGWSAFQALKLSQLAESDRFLLEHVFRMARFGQLDVGMDLVVDPLASVVAIAASAVALLVFVAARGSLTAITSPPRFFGWGSVLLAATLVTVLADGFFLALVGWELAALGVWGLAGDDRRARSGFVRARTADAALVIGAAMLFWGLGGLWTDNDYTPDLAPRFSVVRATVDEDDKKSESDERMAATKSGGKGFITMSAYPGALLFMDDSRTPVMSGDAPLRSPFTRFEVPGGVHSFRIHPGSALDDYLLSNIAVVKDKEVTFGLFGATTSFTQMRDQLVIDVPRAETPPRVMLAGRRGAFGASLVTLASLLIFLAVATRSGQFPFDGWLADAGTSPPLAGALVASVATLSGPYLLARLAPVLALSGAACAVVATVGAASAALFAWRAARAVDLRRILASIGASQLGISLVAAGVGASSAVALVLVAYAPSAAALWLVAAHVEATQRSFDVREMGGLRARMPSVARASFLVCGAMSVLLPGFSGFWAAHTALSAAFASRVAVVPGWLLFALGALAIGLTSFALFRMHFVVFEGKVKENKLADAVGASRSALSLLAFAGAGGGLVLGAGGRLFSARGTSVIGEWIESVRGTPAAAAVGTGRVVPWGLAAILVAVAVAGLIAARARYAPGKRKDDWAKNEPAPESVAPAPDAPPAMATIAVGVERWVWDGVYALAASVTRVAALVAGALEEKIVGVGVDAIGDRAARLDTRARAIGAAACVVAVALILYLLVGRRL